MEKLLKAHLGDCKFADSTTCEFKTSYLMINEPEFYVFDPENGGPVRIVNATADHQLTVRNPQNQTICIVKTDKCLFDETTQKCDCILYDNKQFYLIEIKNSSGGGRGQSRKKAITQLGKTIELLEGGGVNLDSHKVKAVVCFKRTEKRPVNASANSQKAIFLEKYRASLEEGNLIGF